MYVELATAIIVWGLVFSMVGIVFANYSSYDTSLAPTVRGGFVGFGLGAAIAVGIRLARRRWR
jgi:hypothetical protein